MTSDLIKILQQQSCLVWETGLQRPQAVKSLIVRLEHDAPASDG